MNEDYCICCGAQIIEGEQVCYNCKVKYKLIKDEEFFNSKEFLNIVKGDTNNEYE